MVKNSSVFDHICVKYFEQKRIKYMKKKNIKIDLLFLWSIKNLLKKIERCQIYFTNRMQWIWCPMRYYTLHFFLYLSIERKNYETPCFFHHKIFSYLLWVVTFSVSLFVVNQFFFVCGLARYTKTTPFCLKKTKGMELYNFFFYQQI